MNNWGYALHLWHWVVAFLGIPGSSGFPAASPCGSLSLTFFNNVRVWHHHLQSVLWQPENKAFLKSTTFSLNPEQSWQGPATPPHMGELQGKEQLPHVKFEYVPYRKQDALRPIDLPIATLMQFLFLSRRKKKTPHGKNYSSSWVLHDHTEREPSPVHYWGPCFRPQGSHNSALAILIIGLGQLQSSLLAMHKMLPCAELLQRLELWAWLDKHCSSQEVWVLGWFLAPAANLHLWGEAGSLAQGAAADFSEGLRTFSLESF